MSGASADGSASCILHPFVRADKGIVRLRFQAQSVWRLAHLCRFIIGNMHTASTAPAMLATRLRVQRDSNADFMPMSSPKTTTPTTHLTTRAVLKSIRCIVFGASNSIG